MRKTAFLLLTILFLVLVSCTEEIPRAEEPVGVYFELDREKTLSTVAIDAVSYYHYDAQYTGSSVNGVDQGVATDAPLIIEDDGTAYVGKFSQGYWTFTVRAYTSRNTVIYEGSQSTWIAQTPVSVKIVLKQIQQGYGHLALDIVAQKISNEPEIAVAWTKYNDDMVGQSGSSSSSNGSPDWTKTQVFNEADSVFFGTRTINQSQIDALKPGKASERVPNSQHVAVAAGEMIRLAINNSTTGTTGYWYGKVTEACTTSTDPWVMMVSYVAQPDHVRFTTVSNEDRRHLSIKAGRYRLSVSVGSAYDIIDIMVIEGETTTVTGTLNPDVYFGARIQVTEPSPVSGRIAYTGTPGYSVATTYQWVPDAGSATPDRYVWSVNGQCYSNPGTGAMYSTSSTFSFTPPDHGIYTISCDVMSSVGESAYDNVVIDISGTSWQSLGQGILTDYGPSYGTYMTSYSYTGNPDPDHVLLESGTGTRYLVYMGYVQGSGTSSSPYIKWTPYFGGAERSDAMDTATGDRTGWQNCRILRTKDSTGSPHTSGGNQVVSLGGALSRLNDDWAFAPSKDEMAYVVAAVNSDQFDLPADSFWWTSSENPSSPSEAYVLYINGSGEASIITMSKTSTSPGLLYVHLI